MEDLFHPRDRNCTLHVYPLTLNVVRVVQFEYCVGAGDLLERHKAKSTRFHRLLVLQDHDVFNFAELDKVAIKN
jgi:hypothetical protein